MSRGEEGTFRSPSSYCHGERSRLQLHFKLGGQGNSLAVNRPVPLYIVSKSAFCTLNSVKKRVAHPIYSVFYALSVLFEVLKFLEQNKSTYTNPFSKLQREVDYAREDANDNVKCLPPPQLTPFGGD